MGPSRGNGSLHRPDLNGGFKWRKQLLGSLQCWLDLVQMPGKRQRPGFLNGQPGMGFRLKFDGVGPIQQSGHLTAHEEKTSILLDQLRSPVLVACRNGMLDGFGDKSILLIPLGSAAVQLRAANAETGVPGAY